MLFENDIAVVILNWNGKALLEQFLPSVVANTKAAKVYLVDNASTDNSVGFVNTHFPSVSIINNNTNEGYANGYNRALQQLNEKVFCLLNNDVAVTENWLNPIVSAFNSFKQTAIIQPKILDYTNKNYFEYAGAAGGFIDSFGYPYCRGRIFNSIEKDTGQYNDTIDIFWASGACFFIKSEIFKRLGGFDTAFFAHMEEIDLCWRAFNKGYTVKYVGLSEVYHLGGGTLSTLNSKKTYLNFRNSLFVLVKNAAPPIFSRVFVRLCLDGVAAIRFFLLLKPKHTFAILKAHILFYTNIRRVLKQRILQKKRLYYYKIKSIVWLYFVKKQRYY